MINEAYAVLSDSVKRKEYDDSRRFGNGRIFEFSNFRRNFDPFDEFHRNFDNYRFGFYDNDDDDDDDIFSHNNIFRRFKGFGGGFQRGFSKGFGKGFEDFDDMGDFGGGSTFKFSQSSSGGSVTATSKSVKKTTQVM